LTNTWAYRHHDLGQSFINLNIAPPRPKGRGFRYGGIYDEKGKEKGLIPLLFPFN
jgi:hypothetical protein